MICKFNYIYYSYVIFDLSILLVEKPYAKENRKATSHQECLHFNSLEIMLICMKNTWLQSVQHSRTVPDSLVLKKKKNKIKLNRFECSLLKCALHFSVDNLVKPVRHSKA